MMKGLTDTYTAGRLRGLRDAIIIARLIKGKSVEVRASEIARRTCDLIAAAIEEKLREVLGGRQP